MQNDRNIARLAVLLEEETLDEPTPVTMFAHGPPTFRRESPMYLRTLSKLYGRWLLRRNPVAFARYRGVQVGDGCRLLGLRPGTFGSEPYLVRLGDRVTVTGGVQFVTHDGGVWVLRKQFPDIDVFAPIDIGSNVFIGYGAIILPGARVGDNVVIGAGSLVRGSVPSDTVVAGVPARHVATLDAYSERALARALHVRSYAPAAKKAFLLNHFYAKRKQ